MSGESKRKDAEGSASLDALIREALLLLEAKELAQWEETERVPLSAEFERRLQALFQALRDGKT